MKRNRFNTKVVAAALAVLALSACGSSSPEEAATTTAAQTETTVTTTTETTTTLAASRAGLGDPIEVGDWTLTVDAVTPVEGMEVYEPADGVTYQGYKVTISGTFSGEDESTLENFTIKYYGADSKVYADFDSYMAAGDDDWLESDRVIAGGTTSHDFSLAIPVDAIGNNVLIIEDLALLGEEVEVTIPIGTDAPVVEEEATVAVEPEEGFVDDLEVNWEGLGANQSTLCGLVVINRDDPTAMLDEILSDDNGAITFVETGNVYEDNETNRQFMFDFWVEKCELN